MSKSKLDSFQGYNQNSHKLAFILFCDDLGCYFLILIDGYVSFEKTHSVQLCLTVHDAKPYI